MPSPSAPRPRLTPLGTEAKPWHFHGPQAIFFVVAALTWLWPVMEFRSIGGARGFAGAVLAFCIEVICLAFGLVFLTGHQAELICPGRRGPLIASQQTADDGQE
jgi:hypothetical protein